MLFFSFFKTLVNHEVTVELKNDISIRGTLKSVDQYLNIKLDDITVVDELKYPHLVSRSSYLILNTGYTWAKGCKTFIYGERKLRCYLASSEYYALSLNNFANLCHLQSSVKNVFIRGSVVRYVHLPAAAVDTPLLEDATRRGTTFQI